MPISRRRQRVDIVSTGRRLAGLLRPHRLPIAGALVAVLFETAADVLEPWPVAVVVDNVLGGKRLQHGLGRIVDRWFGTNTTALLEFALAAIVLIAVVGGLASYIEKYLTTSVSQWVAHDLRLMVYNRIQRLSLADHSQSRAGDLVMRVTKD